MGIYSNIEATSIDFCRGCVEFKAVCPECFASVCVFCEDECPGCGESVF